MKSNYSEKKYIYLKRIRWGISMFYFGMGLCFSSWATRIPNIKNDLNLSDAQLGSVLLALPIGQLALIFFSAKIVTRFGSNRILPFAILLYAFSLTNIGLAEDKYQLIIGLLSFGIFANLTNIALNTQATYLEDLYKKSIMPSFHGMWSLAGITGALFGLGMLTLDISTYNHFLTIGLIILVLVIVNLKKLIKDKKSIQVKKKKTLSKPNINLIILGTIGFCSMATEGIMFDWSGVYFEEIVNVSKANIDVGYTSFMIMMTSSRFLGSPLINKFGQITIIKFSGFFISFGLLLAVFFPHIIPATLAFMIVGVGVSSIVPLVYSTAGKLSTNSISESLTIVSSISFLGFLIGPLVIAGISELFNLQFSFALFSFFGILIIILAQKIKKLQ